MGTILQQRGPSPCAGRLYRDLGWTKATSWSAHRPEVDRIGLNPNCTNKSMRQRKSPERPGATEENNQKLLPKRRHRSTNNRMSKHSSQVTKSQSAAPTQTDQSQVQPTHSKKKSMRSKNKRHTAAFPCYRTLSDSSPDPAPPLNRNTKSPSVCRQDSDTDLSESEKHSHQPCGGHPPHLELRPEMITSEESTPMSKHKHKCKFDFPDFLPPPFNSWSLSQLAIFYNMEGRASRPRPTGPLERYMERLLQLEWYQIQTWQEHSGTVHTEPLSNSHKPMVSTSARLSTPKCILQCQRAFPLSFLSTTPSHCAYIVCSSRNSSCCRPSGSQAHPARFSPTQDRIGHSSMPKRSYSESRAPYAGCTRSPVTSHGHLKQMQAAGNLRTSVQTVNRLPTTAKDQGLMEKEDFTDCRTALTGNGSEHRKTHSERQQICAEKRRGRSECRKGRAERRAQQEIKPDAVTAIMANLPATKYGAVNRRGRSKQVEFVT